MSTSGGGGYLLHATHIVINESLPTPIPSYMKQKDTLEELNKSDFCNNNSIDETVKIESLDQNVTSENYLVNSEELQEAENKRIKLE